MLHLLQPWLLLCIILVTFAHHTSPASTIEVRRKDQMQQPITTYLPRPTPPPRPEQSLLPYLPTVRRIALRINHRLPRNVDIDDLCSAGIIGLIQASAKFNDSKDVPFLVFAGFRIRGAILDSLRLLDWAPRELRRKGRAAQQAIQKLTSRLAHAPSDEQVAAELGTTLNSYQRLQGDLDGLQLGSLYHQRNRDSEDEELIEVLGRPEDNPLSLCLQGEIAKRVTAAIEGLAPRERLVTTLYYYEEMTIKEIGLTLEICESMASALRRSAVRHLRGTLEDLSRCQPDSCLHRPQPRNVPENCLCARVRSVSL
jgi:RNA polymerase sigma factor for flagellar operon FliA